MAPFIGEQDDVEGKYTEKFRALAEPEGLFVLYPRDRAAIDFGVHLTEPVKGGRKVTDSRVWFQFKGIRTTTLSRKAYEQAAHVSLPIRLGDLKFWFASPEPIYLVACIESTDSFLAEDVLDIVHRQWGESLLDPETFPDTQKEVTVKLLKGAVLTSAIWKAMHGHRSMRLDGPLFRGRPLGHRLDPLRCILKQLEPRFFCDMIVRLLEVHRYELAEELDPALLFPGVDMREECARLTRSRLYHRFEWVPQLTTEIGFGPDDDYREEGAPLHIQGPCAVFIHGNPRSHPETNALNGLAEQFAKHGARRLLVFINSDNLTYFGAFSSGVRGTGIECVPHLLGDIAYNLLTTTQVYLEYRHAIWWRIVNYLYS